MFNRFSLKPKSYKKCYEPSFWMFFFGTFSILFPETDHGACRGASRTAGYDPFRLYYDVPVWGGWRELRDPLTERRALGV